VGKANYGSDNPSRLRGVKASLRLIDYYKNGHESRYFSCVPTPQHTKRLARWGLSIRIGVLEGSYVRVWRVEDPGGDR